MPGTWATEHTMSAMGSRPLGIPEPILVAMLLAVCCLWFLREGMFVMRMPGRRWWPVRLLLMGGPLIFLGLSTLAWTIGHCL